MSSVIYSNSIAVTKAPKDGVSISKVTDYYALSHELTEPTKWDPTPQTMTDYYKYLWNYEVIEYSDGDPEETKKRVIGVYGEKGETGQTGTGIQSITYLYATTSTQDQPDPKNITAVAPPTMDGDNNKYLWTKETILLSRGDPIVNVYLIGVYGDKGETGNKGDQGLIGPSGWSQATISLFKRSSTVPSKDVLALNYTFSTGALSSGVDGKSLTECLNGWSTSVLTGTEPLYVMYAHAFNNTEVDPIDPTDWTDPAILSENGTKGENGYSVMSVILYKRSAESPTKPTHDVTYNFYIGTVSGEDIGTGKWTATVPSSDGNPLWVTNATASSKEQTDTITPSEWSEPQIMAQDGEKGDTGKGIAKIEEFYVASSSNVVVPESWEPTVPKLTADDRYLWNYEKITYTDSTTKSTEKRVIGVYGDKGNTGDVGNGISSIVNYYLATDLDSGVTVETSGWSTTVQAVTPTKRYLWNYEKINYTKTTPTNSTPCIIGVYGDKGETGDKGDTGDKGKSPVSAIFSNESFVLSADGNGIVSKSEYLKVKVVVSLVQGNEYFAPASSLTNGTFRLSYSSSSLFTGEIDGSVFKATKDSVMMDDTEVVTITVNYMDFDGETGTFTRDISLIKARAGKDAILYFAWSKSETEFIPRDSNFFMWGSVFGFFGGKMMGSLPLQQWTTNREKLEELKDDEYCYLWAKLTEKGTPFLFTGKTGSKGLTGACTLYQYYASTSSTEQTGGEWSDEMPSIAGGKFLWMRTKFVPAGGNADDYEWGTPVVAGSDISLLMANIKELGENVEQNTASITANANQIATKVSQTDFNSLGDRVSTAETSIQQNAEAIELRATKDEVTGTIEVTEGKIALYVDGSDVKNSAGIVVGQIDDEGYVKITASQILLDGSVSAGSLSSECFSGKEYKVTAGGAISGGNSELDENGNLKGIGFYLGADGILRVNTSIINDSTATNFTIKGGKFDSESLETVTSAEETTRTVSSKAFPTDSSKWYYDRSLLKTAIINHLSVNNEVDLQSNCNILLGGKTYVNSNKYNLFSQSSSDIAEFSEEQSIACTISKTYTKTFTNQAIKLNILNGGTLQGYYSWDGYYTDEDVYVQPTYGWVVTSIITSDINPDGSGNVPSNPSVGDSYYTVVEKNGKFIITDFTYKKTGGGYWTTEEKWHDGGSAWGPLRLSYKRVYVNGEEKALDSWLYIGDGEQTVTLKYEVGYTGSYDGSYTQYRWKDDGSNHRFYCTKSYRIYYRYKYDGKLQFQTTSNLYLTVLRTADGELLFAENLTSDTSYGQDDVSITINDTKYLEAGKRYTTWTGADKCALPENNGESGSGNVSSGTFLGTTLSTNDILIINGSTVSVVGEHSLIINGNTYIKESEWDTKTGFSVILMSKIKGVHATDIYRKDGGYGRIGDAGNPFTALYVEFIGNLFPVGSIYMSFLDTSPASFLGGTWEKLGAGYTFWTQTGTDALMDSNGNPVTPIPAGLPNIKGTLFIAKAGAYGNGSVSSGAFSITRIYDGNQAGVSPDNGTVVSFNANSGATTQGIYSDSVTTVQPPAYKVYAWRRIN